MEAEATMELLWISHHRQMETVQEVISLKIQRRVSSCQDRTFGRRAEPASYFPPDFQSNPEPLSRTEQGKTLAGC